jgi:hypothetical protein
MLQFILTMPSVIVISVVMLSVAAPLMDIIRPM